MRHCRLAERAKLLCLLYPSTCGGPQQRTGPASTLLTCLRFSDHTKGKQSWVKQVQDEGVVTPEIPALGIMQATLRLMTGHLPPPTSKAILKNEGLMSGW